MKMFRKGLGILTACMLVLGMTSGASWADDFDAAMVQEGEVEGSGLVFPGDTITNVELTMDGAPVNPEVFADGTSGWTNRSGRVYVISPESVPMTVQVPVLDQETQQPIPVTDGEGNIVYDENGDPQYQMAESESYYTRYNLSVWGGTVEVAYGTLNSGVTAESDYYPEHAAVYNYTDGTNTQVQLSSEDIDAAAYPQDTVVSVTALPRDGMAFQRWQLYSIDEQFLTPITDDALRADESPVPGLYPEAMTSETLNYTVKGSGSRILFMPVFAASVTESVSDETQQTDPYTGEVITTPVTPENTPVTPENTPVTAENNQGENNQGENNQGTNGDNISIFDNANIGALNTDYSNSNSTDNSQENQQQAETPQPVTYTLSLDHAVSDTDLSALTADTEVHATADDRTAEGLVFDHWEAQGPENFGLDGDQIISPSITFRMPAGNVALSAQYVTVQPETFTLTLTNASSSQENPDALTAGTEVTVTANDREAENLVFDHWTEEGLGLSGEQALQSSFTFSMPSWNVVLTAEYRQKTYSVTLTNASSNQENPNALLAGTEVIVTADNKEAENLTFDHWTVEGMELTGEQSAQSSITISMPAANVVLTAEYAEVTPTETITALNATIENVNATDNGDGTASATVEEGTTVRVTANEAPEGTKFEQWNVTAQGDAEITTSSITEPTLEVTVAAADVTVEPVYTAQTEAPRYTLTVNSGSIGTAGAGNTGSYLATDVVTIVAAAPQAGWRFTKWTASDGVTIASETEATTTITMPGANAAVTANYEQIPFNLTVNSGDGSGQHYLGDQVVITANPPQTGYRFRNWTITSGTGKIASDISSQTTFTMDASDAVVTANYELIPYTLNVKKGSGSGTYTMGTSVDITPNFPASGKEFDKWEKTSGSISFDSVHSYYATVTMKASDATVTALYKDGPNPNNNTITGLENGAEYLKSTTLTFTAGGAGMENSNPNPGDYRYRPASYQIGSVGGSWSASPYTTSMAINAVGDYTLTVTYAKDVYDGNSWNADGTTVTKSITFHVVNALSVQTGDSSPLLPLVIAGCAALAVIILLAVILIKRRKR